MTFTDGLLDQAALRSLLTELAERLARRGVRANLYIVGGAAIAMQFDERRATRDIDSVVLEGHGPLMAEVIAMARLHGLPTTWLNEQATVYVSSAPDPGRQLVFDHPYLSVAAASAEHLLAMKLQAARGSDAQDIALLVSSLDIKAVAEAEAILANVFPGVTLRQRARLLLEDVLAEKQ